MAATEFKQLLVKIGLSATEYSALIKQIKKDTQDVQDQTRQTAKEAMDASKLQLAATKEQIAAEQLLQNQARTMASLDQAKLVWRRQLTAEQQTIAATARAETAEIQKQIALLRQKTAEEKAAKAAHAEGGEKSGLLGGLMEGLQGLAGGGLLGSVFAGAFGGGGLIMIVSKAVEVVGELVKKLAEIPFEAGEIAEKFENMAARTGASVEELEKLRLAGSAVGMGMEQMSMLLTRMAFQFTKNLGEGASRAEKLLHRFGIEVRDSAGNIKPLTEIMLELSALFEKLPDGWTKNRIMIEAFGRQGAQLIPVLNQGRAALEGMFREAGDLSIVFSKELIDAQHRYNIEAEKWNMEWEQFKVTLGEGILPLLVEAFSWINKIIQAMNIDADVPKRFAEDMANWATSRDAMAAAKSGKPGQYARQQLTKEGEGRMKEEIPQTVMDRYHIAFKKTWEEWYAQARDAGNDTSFIVKAFGEQFPDAFEKAVSGMGKLDPRLTDLEAKMKKLDAATQKFLETQAKMNEETEQAAITGVKEEKTDQYKQGMLAYDDYANAIGRLDKEMYDSRVRYIEQWATAEKKRLSDSEKDSAVFAKREETLELEKQMKLGKAWEQYQNDKHKLKLQGDQDDLAATHVAVKMQEALAKESLANITKLTENAFQDRQITAEQYINLRKAQFDAERADEIEGIKAKYAYEADNDKRAAMIKGDVAKAEMDYERKVTEFMANEASIRDKFAKQEFDNVKQELQGLLGAQQTQGAGSTVFGSTAIATLTQLRNISLDYLRNRIAALKLEDAGTETWHKTKLEVLDAVKEVQLYNQQLLTAKDILVPIADVFGQLAKDLGQFGGHTAQELANAFKVGSNALQQFSHLKEVLSKGKAQDPIQQLRTNLQDVFAKVKGMSDTTGAKFSDLAAKTDGVAGRMHTFADALLSGKTKVVDSIDKLVAAFDHLTGTLSGNAPGEEQISPDDFGRLSGPGAGPDMTAPFPTVESANSGALDEAQNEQTQKTKDATSKLSQFAEKITATIGAISGLIAAFASAQSGLGGAVGGGTAVFGALSMFTSNPFALAGGAIGGAILGGIIGSKRSAAKKMADDFKKQTQDIIDSVHDGTTTLKDGIADLQKERNDAIASLSHDKKGKKELQGVLDQIDGAIKQLRQQQAQLMKDLHEQVQILGAPDEYQQWLTSLDSILKKYKEFADAAETVDQLNEAQQFLNLSLQQYSRTLQQEVESAQEDAINNAIQLMDLQQQASDLMAQEAQEEYNILTQGNLTRQMTSAQTKGAQIEAARKSRDQQLDQINKQIALAQFKVDQEKQIFNLATTRIGLESQLLELQKTQTLRDIARITALQNLISALGSGGITNLSELLQQLGLAPAPSANNGGGGGGENIESLLLKLAQERGAVGEGAGLQFRLL